MNMDTKEVANIKHIMISYQWGYQEMAIKVREKLRSEGYNIWMDVEKMGGDTISCMAKAVENAEVVLICITKKYQESKNCKSEAEYAYNKDKLIIPLMCEAKFKPSDWLGFISGTKLYYRAYTDELLEEFPNLVRNLGDKGKATVKAKWTPVNKAKNKALQCSICLEKFKQPKALPCLHSFCKICLFRLAPLGTKTISCPLCREEFSIPDGDVSQFRTNFHLKELCEEESSRQQQFPAGVEFSCTCCETGKQTRVVAKCQDCKLYICSAGLEAHYKFSGLRDHQLLVFEDHNEAPSTKMTTPSEVSATDWELFDDMYDEEYSNYLLQYWRQRQGSNGNNWQSEMVGHYLSGLSDLEENRQISGQLLVQRRHQVATVFKQAGECDTALQLVEKSIAAEERKPSGDSTHIANFCYLAADIYREKLNKVTFVKELQGSLLHEQIKYARRALEIRSTMPGEENKFILGEIQRLLSIALKNWAKCGSDSSLSAEDARTEARKHIDDAIDTFKELNAKGNVAKALANKAGLEERGSDEKEQLFREALSLCEEAFGKFSVSSGHLYRNMYILYYDRKDYDKAYEWLLKCKETREKVYGQYHPQTQQVYDALEKDDLMKSRDSSTAR